MGKRGYCTKTWDVKFFRLHLTNVSFGICDYTRPFPILTLPETGSNSPIERNAEMPGLIHSKIAFLIAAVVLTSIAGSTTLAQEPILIPPGVEIMSLEKAINLGLLNNRSAKNARLETEKADDRTAAARTRMLPGFKLNAGVSKPPANFHKHLLQN